MFKEEIIKDIEKYVGQSRYSNWYAGVASKPRERLFNDHNVSEKNGSWIFREAYSDDVARDVEEYLLRMGMHGGTGGGSESTQYVYAYLITNYTRQ